MLVCDQALKLIRHLFVLIAPNRTVAIARLADLKSATSQRNADPMQRHCVHDHPPLLRWPQRFLEALFSVDHFNPHISMIGSLKLPKMGI